MIYRIKKIICIRSYLNESLSELYKILSEISESTYEENWKGFDILEIDKGRERYLKLWLVDVEGSQIEED